MLHRLLRPICTQRQAIPRSSSVPTSALPTPPCTLLLETPPELFTADQAKIAGSLIATTEKYGLSLGDRSCLALAIALKAPVYTTEQAWKNLKVGVSIHVIR